MSCLICTWSYLDGLPLVGNDLGDNIWLFVVIQPGLIVLFAMLWLKERQKAGTISAHKAELKVK